MIALSAALANGSLAFVSQPVKARTRLSLKRSCARADSAPATCHRFFSRAASSCRSCSSARCWATPAPTAGATTATRLRWRWVSRSSARVTWRVTWQARLARSARRRCAARRRASSCCSAASVATLWPPTCRSGCCAASHSPSERSCCTPTGCRRCSRRQSGCPQARRARRCATCAQTRGPRACWRSSRSRATPASSHTSAASATRYAIWLMDVFG
jgi:hypothetical protein